MSKIHILLSRIKFRTKQWSFVFGVLSISGFSEIARADPCLDLRLLIRGTDSKIPRLSFLDQMTPENLDWVSETVRVPAADATEAAALKNKDYLEKMKLVSEDFDQHFRTEDISKDFRNLLKREHKILTIGPEGTKIYAGTTDGNANATFKVTAKNADLFISDQPEFARVEATIRLKKRDYTPDPRYYPKSTQPEKPWTGPGPQLDPPPNLSGPFPEVGKTDRLELPGVIQKAKAAGFSSPQSVTPKNYNENGVIFHQYPAFGAKTQGVYLDQMTEDLRKIQTKLLTNPHPTDPDAILSDIADYYQVGINAHLFSRVNNSLLMNHVNYLIHFMGLKGIPHGELDYYALYKSPEAFQKIFLARVKDRNLI